MQAVDTASASKEGLREDTFAAVFGPIGRVASHRAGIATTRRWRPTRTTNKRFAGSDGVTDARWARPTPLADARPPSQRHGVLNSNGQPSNVAFHREPGNTEGESSVDPTQNQRRSGAANASTKPAPLSAAAASRVCGYAPQMVRIQSRHLDAPVRRSLFEHCCFTTTTSFVTPH